MSNQTHGPAAGPMTAERGFTLIELAIVLVIFGIILTGILAGARVIQNARIANLQQDIANYRNALVTYQERFGTFPGLDNLGTTRWGATTSSGGVAFTVTDDGATFAGTTLDAATVAPAANTSGSALVQLRAAGLIPPLPTSPVPTHPSQVNPFEGIYGVSFDPLTGTQSMGMSVCATNLPAAAATAVMARYGSGQPNDAQGRARSRAMVPLIPAGTAPLWGNASTVGGTTAALTAFSTGANDRFIACVRAENR